LVTVESCSTRNTYHFKEASNSLRGFNLRENLKTTLGCGVSASVYAYVVEPQLREHRQHSPPDATVVAPEALHCPAGGTSIRVLLVDDNPNDRAIALRELKREFPEIALTEICTAKALDTVFESAGEFDLLITDYQLFWADGIEVTNRAKERWPDMPVIMLTGTGNEEVAVRAMKAGVSDYVLKSPRDYHRLSAAVRAALNKRDHSRELAAAEARYAALFDTVPVGLFRCTPQGTLLDVNPAFAAILGTRREQLVGRNFATLHPEGIDFQRWRDELEREGSVAWVESRFQTFEGEIRCIQIHAKAVRDPVTREVFYEGSVEDVTDSKRAEVEREELITELQAALGRVRTLTGLLPICAACKKIRDERGRWNMLERFIEDHSQAHFTHSFCPECARELYPEVFLDTPKI
jgi:PAS domain S-box-containing protein